MFCFLVVNWLGCCFLLCSMPIKTSLGKYAFEKKKERMTKPRRERLTTQNHDVHVPLKQFEMHRGTYSGVDPQTLKRVLTEQNGPLKRRRLQQPHKSAMFNALSVDMAHGKTSFRGAQNYAACSAADCVNGGGKVPEGTVAMASCGNCGECPQNIERDFNRCQFYNRKIVGLTMEL